jgi:hypothetical protein
MSGYWEDLGDSQQYVSQQVSLNRIARLRNERVLHFIYSQRRTCPTTALSTAFRQHVDAQNLPAAEALLRQLLDFHFVPRPRDEDDVNITLAEWALVVFRIHEILRVDGPGGHLLVGEDVFIVRAVSDQVVGQGRQHRITVILPRYSANHDTNLPRALIRYSGFLSYATFRNNWGRMSDDTADFQQPAQQTTQQPAQQTTQQPIQQPIQQQTCANAYLVTSSTEEFLSDYLRCRRAGEWTRHVTPHTPRSPPS